MSHARRIGTRALVALVLLIGASAFGAPEDAWRSLADVAQKPSQDWFLGVRVAVLDGVAPEEAWTEGKVEWITCDEAAATRLDDSAAEFDLAPRCPLKVRVKAGRAGASAIALKRSVTIIPAESFAKDVVVSLPIPVAAWTAAWAPRYDGIGEETALGGDLWWTWSLDGMGKPVQDPKQRLAIPVLGLSGPGACTLIADPLFSTTYRCRAGDKGLEADATWLYLGSKVPLSRPVTRTVWTVLNDGSGKAATDAWYATALADVPEGPDWLHDVAWQHYDYLSHGGRGWFEDIDAVEKLVAPEDRGKIVFTLHGWYDLLGRYTFDAKTGKLDDSWTAFPNAAAVRDKGFDVSESVPMTKAEMHRRMRYAKDRGFRVCLYFADGLTACEEAGVFSEDKLLAWGGWQGPDTLGRSYTQNPAHPDVYRWYVRYLEALLAEYGRDIDALVWDETFMVRAGMTAPANAPEPAYLCAPFMRLVEALTRITTSFRGDLAFLTSDDVGMTSDEGKTFWTDVPPYAVMSHGCYQDSHSRPQVWPYGIFPNLRNTLWSCNWAAVTNFEFTRFGVEHYDTPVATSNGWLDSKGVARLSEDQLQRVLPLFRERKGKRQELHWLTGPAPEWKG